VQFRINHVAVIAQANAIARLADDLQAQIKKLNLMEQKLRAGWRGQAANAFLDRATELRAEINTQRQQMAALANTIRNAANAIQRADEEAARQAANLPQGN
jgi:WXG100 family type VII secretion target